MSKKFQRIYLSFNGRISRPTFFWHSFLVAATFLIIFVFLETLVSRSATWILYPPFFWAVLALMMKRLHDRGQSAWWMLIVMIRLLGPIWLFITLLLRKGSPGENQYGSDPREYGADYLSVDISSPGGVK